MKENTGVARERFGSSLGAIFTAAGAAVGLGNIWGFPYVAGKNGGGVFVIMYLVAVLLIGIPLMISEFVIGREGRKNMIGSLKKLAPGTSWHLGGWLCVVSCFLILGFYGVVAGWSMAHVVKALGGVFVGLGAEEIGKNFGAFINDPYWPVVWHGIFMGATAFVVMGGLRNGIERFAKVVMPLLFVILVVLMVRSLTLDGAQAGLDFLFRPDFSVVRWKTVAIAIGAAFFSIGVGNGVMVTLGSYMDDKDNLAKDAFMVSMTDTAVAVISGLAIFPAVLALGFEPAKSSGLAFVTVPAVLQQLPGGLMVHYVFTVLFFLLLSIAALSSSVTTLEVVVAYFCEDMNVRRPVAVAGVAGAMFAIGIPCALSVGAVNIKVMGVPLVWFLVDFIEAFLLPLGGIICVLFVGWHLPRKQVEGALSRDETIPWYFEVFYTLIRYIIPVVIFVVLAFTANEYFFHIGG
ncbi:sodium-dependent transporter [Dethiosulfovibrio sp. F2B]|uniref:sodium-dependent transporter n=1 Tax=Dethiosulfovibrio faecalis TaxID=2720018 RepID=UPI001F2DD3E8|nr:sodium-dependent transporter [Dethiosulfovibrio faecalis]MCF4152391.1 sodium-dependent transporter [Dethiosulfovibrio faecalis]